MFKAVPEAESGEKYRTLGLYYGTASRNYEKAIDNYATLIRLYPADGTGHNNLALSAFMLAIYVRLRGEGYTDKRLGEWIKKIRSQDWTEAYVFFRHEDTGAGPKFDDRRERRQPPDDVVGVRLE